MSKGQENYTLLISKLDAFIRKFYINKLIRGFLYFTGLILVFFLAFSLLEHQFYFPGAVRKLFFFSFILLTLGSLAYWIIYPLTKYFHLGKTISHEQAAVIIGNHFFSVKDQLLNILQLKKLSDSTQDRELIEASIAQKSEKITPIPFRSAIDYRNNRKYLKYALPPFLLLLLLLFAAPSLITESTNRIINNDKEYERSAPFRFVLKDESPAVVQFKDYKLLVEVEGSALPNEVFIDVDNYQYRLKKLASNQFEYTFRNVQKDMTFRLFSGKYDSDEYGLKILEKPNLINFSLQMDYPAYTKYKDETLENIGDVVVPQGTKISWTFQSHKTDNISMLFSNANIEKNTDRKSENEFIFGDRFLKDELYKVFISNKQIPEPDSIIYSINVVPDKYPTINVESFQDSVDKSAIYFLGQAADDYGLQSLSFNYQIVHENGKQEALVSEKILGVSPSNVNYEYLFDLIKLDLRPGDKLIYYFQVFDNDAVNGSKSSKTGIMSFAKPSLEELKAKEEKNSEEIKDSLEKNMEESKKIQDQLKKIREKLLQKKEMEWEDRKELEQLLDKQKELEKKLEEAKKKFDENLKNQQEEPTEKQQKLQKMFEEVQSPEMQDLMEKIQDLLQELDKEDAIQMMEEMEMNDQTKEKEMDRLLELYKQLEVEKDINDLVEELNKLAEEQEKLAEETEEKAGEEEKSKEDSGQNTEEEKQAEKDQEALNEKQEEINKDFEELEKKLEEIEKKNEELERPKDLGEENEEKMDEISEELEKSQEELGKKENKKASKSQKKAAQKMKNMAGNLQSQMESGEMEQMEEDMQALRQLLENLIGLSYDQEDLVAEFTKTQLNTPRYVSLVQDQNNLKDDFVLIRDSLEAMSKRVIQIESFVLEKVAEVDRNLKESVVKLEDRQKALANDHQRKTMTYVNDLALMLSETMNQMQQQMSSMKPGNQMCEKPGNSAGEKGKSGKVPMDKITKGQEGLNEEMKGMMEKMGKGKSGKMSKEFAQAAARQAALRKALEEIQKSKMEQGKGDKALQELIEQMDEIETDLVNKRLNKEMLDRQKDILTRLLEADRAERQREFDNQREAQNAKDKSRDFPPALDEYIKKRESEIDFYKTVSPSLRPYYKYLVESYYQALKQNQ